MTRSRSTPIPAGVAQAAMKTIRPRDAGGIYAHPRAEFARLSERGLLHRVADGYYIVVPQDKVGRASIPGLEAAAAGITTAIYGPDDAIVTGPIAARLHGAIPRALAVATIAAARQHREVELSHRQAVVRFVKRASTCRECLDEEAEEEADAIASIHRPTQRVHRISYSAGNGRAAVRTD